VCVCVCVCVYGGHKLFDVANAIYSTALYIHMFVRLGVRTCLCVCVHIYTHTSYSY